MSEQATISNIQAVRKVMGSITKAEWTELSAQERKELGNEARKVLSESKD